MKGMLVVITIVTAISAGIAAYAINGTSTIQGATTTVAYSVNGGSLPVPAGCSLAKSESSQGYRMEIYLPSAAKAGASACMMFVVQNVNHTGSPELSGLTAKIIDAKGDVVGLDAGGCNIAGSDTTFPVRTQFVCTTFWNAAVPAGTYHVNVDISFPASGSNPPYDVTTSANMTLSG